VTEQLKKIVLVGGSGFIGSKLTEELLLKGYSITVVDLVPPRIVHDHLTFLKLNFAKEVPPVDLFEGVYGVVNLAGATIGKRWNKEYKELIYKSRIDTTKAIVDLMAKTNAKPAVLVNASAVGYYGDRKEELLSENELPGTDFLANVCTDWEREAQKAELFGVRVCMIRTAHVLGPGGILATLEPIFKLGLGGYFGKGDQYMPWIHYKDVVGIYSFALDQQVQGPINVSAGVPVTQKSMFQQFARTIGAPLPFIFRIPKFFAWIVLGDFVSSLYVSQNTDTTKILSLGYRYQFEDLEIALSDLYKEK
jgi:uncharacterized protein (TIGR01777 family)